MLICLILITTLCSRTVNYHHPRDKETQASWRLTSNSWLLNGPVEIYSMANLAPEFVQDRGIQNNNGSSDCT